MEPREEKRDYYYVKEVADIVGVHKMTILNYIKRGIIPERRKEANNYRVFYQEDIDQLMRVLKPRILKQATPGSKHFKRAARVDQKKSFLKRSWLNKRNK